MKSPLTNRRLMSGTFFAFFGAFVRAFVAAWDKVVNLDRFDLG